MSGHLRFCFAAVVLLAALPTSPASSNPFTDLFNAAPAPVQAAAPASAEEECLPRPGKSTAAGQRWVYRFDGHRKCWFQTAQGIATVKKQVRHGAAKPPVAVPEENETAPPKQNAVVDARAELLRSAPPEASQPTPAAPEFKVVDAASVPATGPAASVPPAPVAFPVAEAADDGQGWMATLLGVLLMALGLVSVLGSSPALREAVLLRD